MSIQRLTTFDLSDSFNLKSIAAVQELSNHDLIYIYHHLKPGCDVLLESEGTNIKGDIRYKVTFRHFTLGYVSLGGYFRGYYENNATLTARIVSIKQEKFLPARHIDIEVDLVKLKNVS
ncbi:MAG: hypothetical protein HYZ14_16570 [Bacteroidetes bacterium]|nr:hypothetical protein [Bacteroidota bacterium]